MLETHYKSKHSGVAAHLKQPLGIKWTKTTTSLPSNFLQQQVANTELGKKTKKTALNVLQTETIV